MRMSNGWTMLLLLLLIPLGGCPGVLGLKNDIQNLRDKTNSDNKTYTTRIDNVDAALAKIDVTAEIDAKLAEFNTTIDAKFAEVEVSIIQSGQFAGGGIYVTVLSIVLIVAATVIGVLMIRSRNTWKKAWIELSDAVSEEKATDVKKSFKIKAIQAGIGKVTSRDLFNRKLV